MSRTGGALAGAPIGYLADKYKFAGVLKFLIGMSLVGGLATVPLWNVGGTAAEVDDEQPPTSDDATDEKKKSK